MFLLFLVIRWCLWHLFYNHIKFNQCCDVLKNNVANDIHSYLFDSRHWILCQCWDIRNKFQSVPLYIEIGQKLGFCWKENARIRLTDWEVLWQVVADSCNWSRLKIRSARTWRLSDFDISPVLLAPSVQVSSWFPAETGWEDVCGYRRVHNYLPLFSALYQHTRQLPLSLCGWLWTQPQWPHHLQVHIG